MGWGLFRLDLEVRPAQALTIVATALAVQALATRWIGLPRLDLRSPLISAMSLCLLLRTSSLTLAIFAAILAIGSKFLIRSRGKHIFNPSAFALVVLLALPGDAVWISGGQWGSAALALFAVSGIGHLVVRRAKRSDVTWAFLIAYTVLLFGRATWLGDPWTIGWHQLCRGSLLIFAFFMISDPRTAPNSRGGRILWATLIAAGALYIEHYLFHPNGPLWALMAGALLVPAIDRLMPAERHRWRRGAT
ncbi:MAG: RnfABCDGE type electron transport complex subunit D [Acidobacteriota bacterium]